MLRCTKTDATDAVPDFNVFTEDYLQPITIGVYQLKQAFSY